MLNNVVKIYQGVTTRYEPKRHSFYRLPLLKLENFRGCYGDLSD